MIKLIPMWKRKWIMNCILFQRILITQRLPIIRREDIFKRGSNKILCRANKGIVIIKGEKKILI